MKIIKSFEDPEFFTKVYIKYDPNVKSGTWLWGLGDDGNIYCRCSNFSAPTVWFKLGVSPVAINELSIREMKRLIKEFDHLLVFL